MNSDQNFRQNILSQINKTKPFAHGYWNVESFREWGLECLILIKETSGVNSGDYKEFNEKFSKVFETVTDDKDYPLKVAQCISVLKKIIKN